MQNMLFILLSFIHSVLYSGITEFPWFSVSLSTVVSLGPGGGYFLDISSQDMDTVYTLYT